MTAAWNGHYIFIILTLYHHSISPKNYGCNKSLTYTSSLQYDTLSFRAASSD